MEVPDQYFHGGFCYTASHLTPEKRHHSSSLENKEQHFAVEDLLDFSKDEDVVGMDGDDVASGLDSTAGGSSTDSSTVTAVDSCNSASFSGYDPGLAAAAAAGGGGGDAACRMGFGDSDHFSGELCVPYDDLAELEWLSNFVEEPFSSEDLQKQQLLSGIKAQRDQGPESTHELQPDQARAGHHNSGTINSPIFQSDVSVPAKARSKRSRAAPCNWDSRLIALTEPDNCSSHIEPERPAPVLHPSTGKKNPRAGPKKKPAGPEGAPAGDARKCLHCATDKTPQWRTGPMGPKTLCNACGVRYKSGRLVPEYRPAASPTFVLTKHSNSHRKVLELRRQKDLLRAQQHQQFGLRAKNVVFDMSGSDDHLIHQHVGPDFRQLI